MRHHCALALLLPLLGCSGAQTGDIVQGAVPVNGIATYQGKPLEGYAVFFSNLSDRPATGMVDAQGRFVLGSNGPDDGAPPGTHKVWFNYSPVVEVQLGREQADAAPPPPKVKLPKNYTRMETSGITVEVPEDGLTDYKLDLK